MPYSSSDSVDKTGCRTLRSDDTRDSQNRFYGSSDDVGISHDTIERPFFKGIRISVSALKPYLSQSAKPKITHVHVLEIDPDGEKGLSVKKTISELLQLIYPKVSPESVGLSHDFQGEKLARQQGETREIQYQDLRYLENQFCNHDDPIILVRKHAILVAMNPIRAVITANKMFLIAPTDSESLLDVLFGYMKGIFQDKSSQLFAEEISASPEITAFKSILATITALHRQSFAALSTKVESELHNLKQATKITAERQDTLRALKTAVLSHMININMYELLLKTISESSYTLALMNLTLLQENPVLYRKPLQPELLNQKGDFSMLLESYLMDHHAIGTKLKFLEAQIRSSEALISFRLDMYRNDLLFVEMILLICMLSLTVGSFVTSSLGMNLNTGFALDSPLIFWVIAGILTTLLISLTLYLMFRYRLTGSISATIVKQ